jgi:hypothetical protein
VAELADVERRGRRAGRLAKRSPARNPNTREDSQSVGSVVTFGQFRVLDLGDLPWNQELALMCPANTIGTVDLYMVSVHGLASSGSSAAHHAVPRMSLKAGMLTRQRGAGRSVERCEHGQPEADETDRQSKLEDCCHPTLPAAFVPGLIASTTPEGPYNQRGGSPTWHPLQPLVRQTFSAVPSGLRPADWLR